MKKISFNTFFILLFTSILLSIAIISVLVINKFHKIQNIRNYSKQYENFTLEWFDAQKSQYSFLTKYKDDQVFFQSEQNKFIKKYQIKSTNCLNKIDSLLLERNTLKLDIYDDLQLYKDNIYNIDGLFYDISHTVFLRGSKNTGIIGNIFSFYSTIIVSTNNQLYLNYIEKMNFSFLNYLNDPSISHYNYFLESFSELNFLITQTNKHRDTSIIDTTTLVLSSDNKLKDFVENLNNYKQSFSKLVNLDRKLFLNEQFNLMKSLSEANDNFNEIILTNKEIIDTNYYKSNASVNTSLIIFLVALFLFAVLALIIVPPLIVKRIDDFKEYITPLKYGQIPDLMSTKIFFVDLVNIYGTIENFVKSLKSASEFANEIGKGNFGYNYKPISNQDELGNALILLRDNLQRAKEEEQKRKKEDDIRLWINTGIAKFSDILRQSSNLETLSSLVIRELVNYVGANQGGIFILNDERKDNILLELTASYAYSKERKKRKVFHLGESLVGTCAVEKASIFMTDIPQDYISITSGLGEATPRCLLLTPLKFEDNVLGVIEIASFEIIEKYKIEFVERIAESFASTISIAKINQQTVKLLENAKIEAEQRSLKEEELRQNLEELRATQEKISLQQDELNKLLSMISETAIVVDFDVNGNFFNVPDRFLRELNLSLNDLLGHNLAEFDSSQDSKLSNLEFWQQLFEGKTQKVLYKYDRLQDEEIWFSLTLHPWSDKSGEIIKFIGVFIDITEQVRLKNQFEKSFIDLKEKDKLIEEKLKEMENLNNTIQNEKENLKSTLEKLKLVQQTLEKQNEKNETLLKEVDESMKKTQKQLINLRRLFDKTDEAFQLIFNGKFIHCNDKTLKLFGYETEDEFIKLHPGEISPITQPDGVDSFKKANEMIKKAIDEGSNEFEWTHKRKDGSVFNCIVSLVSIIVGDNTYIYCLVKPI